MYTYMYICIYIYIYSADLEVIKMIDDMVVNLKKEQKLDESKKAGARIGDSRLDIDVRRAKSSNVKSLPT